jgi:hypothetical protein
VIAAVELLAVAQLAVISILAVALTCRRVAIARAEGRRRVLLDRYRDAVVEFVGLDEDTPPVVLAGLWSAEQRSAGRRRTAGGVHRNGARRVTRARGRVRD